MVYFVVPVYKVEKYLARCIESVLSQTYEDTYLILVDDGSPDNCGKICDEYSEKYGNITCIHKENGGLSDARNKGIELALSLGNDEDYITFLDSDDYVRAEFAERLVEISEKYSAGVVQPAYEKGSADAFETAFSKTEPLVKSAKDALLGYNLKSMSIVKMYKLSLFRSISFPRGVWNEDEFTTYKAVYNSEKTAFVDEKLYYYFQHPGSIMSSIAKKLKGNPHKEDWLCAYKERIEFFEARNEDDQVLKTHEKICTDIILRYCEQMHLPKEERDPDASGERYLSIYRESYKKMIVRKSLPLKRKMMFFMFRICPMSAVAASRIFTLRK